MTLVATGVTAWSDCGLPSLYFILALIVGRQNDDGRPLQPHAGDPDAYHLELRLVPAACLFAGSGLDIAVWVPFERARALKRRPSTLGAVLRSQ